MISGISESELLEYLMNSDFNEGLKPDEFKFLLLNFRYHYRLLNGRFESFKVGTDGKIRDLESNLQSIKKENEKLEFQSSIYLGELNSLKSRKLSLKERFLGKIIIDENENKGF